MDDERPWYETVALPALLRAARRTYGAALRAAQAEAGFGDIPRNGSYLLGAISRTGSPLGAVIREMGMTKQAAGQLVDTLVVRGYLDRSTDLEDRRRMTVALTERGRLAASAGAAVAARVEAELVARVGADHVAHTRATLAALVGIGAEDGDGVARG
jgi:DNA-binding MarR family transcriptional regulator